MATIQSRFQPRSRDATAIWANAAKMNETPRLPNPTARTSSTVPQMSPRRSSRSSTSSIPIPAANGAVNSISNGHSRISQASPKKSSRTAIRSATQPPSRRFT